MEETIQKIHTLTYLLEKNHDQNGTPTNNRFGLSIEGTMSASAAKWKTYS